MPWQDLSETWTRFVDWGTAEDALRLYQPRLLFCLQHSSRFRASRSPLRQGHRAKARRGTARRRRAFWDELLIKLPFLAKSQNARGGPMLVWALFLPKRVVAISIAQIGTCLGARL